MSTAYEYLQTPLGMMRVSATEAGLTEAAFIEGAEYGATEQPARGNAITAV